MRLKIRDDGQNQVILILTDTAKNMRRWTKLEEFKYLGTTLTNKNSIQEEIKSRLKLGNACYYSVQNLLSSSLLSKGKNQDI